MFGKAVASKLVTTLHPWSSVGEVTAVTSLPLLAPVGKNRPRVPAAAAAQLLSKFTVKARNYLVCDLPSPKDVPHRRTMFIRALLQHSVTTWRPQKPPLAHELSQAKHNTALSQKNKLNSGSKMNQRDSVPFTSCHIITMNIQKINKSFFSA